MKNNMRKGFTMVELLVVMAIISILAGFAVVKMSDSKKAAYLTSMKNDARNSIATTEAYYSTHDEYPTFYNHDFMSDKNDKYGDRVWDGFYTHAEDLKYALYSNDNHTAYDKLRITPKTCDYDMDGYILEVTNIKVGDKYIYYDSCDMASPQLKDK